MSAKVFMTPYDLMYVVLDMLYVVLVMINPLPLYV